MKIQAITPFRFINNKQNIKRFEYKKDSFKYSNMLSFEKKLTPERLARKEKADIKRYFKECDLSHLACLWCYSYEQTLKLKEILSTEALIQNKKLLAQVHETLSAISTSSGIDCALKIIKEILEHEDILEDEQITKYILNIAPWIKNSNQMKMLRKILSHKELCTNKDFMQYAGSIVHHCSDPKECEFKLKVIDKALADEDVINNEIAMKYLGKMLYVVTSDANSQLASTYLSHKELYSNESFMSACKASINTASMEKHAQAKIKIIERVLEDEKLKNNETVMENLSNLIISNDLSIKLSEYDKEHFNRIMLEALGYLSIDQIWDFIRFDNIFYFLNLKAYKENKEHIKDINNQSKMDPYAKNLLVYELMGISALYSFSGDTLRSKMSQIKVLQNAMANGELKQETLDVLNLEEKLEKLQNSLMQVITPTEVSVSDVSDMMKGFFANNNPKLEKLLSRTDFSVYGKNGLPLKYSREQYISDLNEIFKNIDNAQKRDILRKLDIELCDNGYNGIIDLTKLSDKGIEGEVLTLTNKFIRKNSILTGNKDLDKALNSLIKGMPEFINIIGKKQHDTHDYSLDIHILTVLKEAMKNPEYQELTNIEKFCLKLAIILHDIAKPERENDKNHPTNSAYYARDILNKKAIKLPYELKNRIFELIKNHHWLEDYDKRAKNEKEIAALFRRKGDLKIAQIMSEADLKAVDRNHSFYNMHKKSLTHISQQNIENAINNINSYGQIFLTNKIIDPKKLAQKATVEYKGRKYRVIDFTKLKRNANLSEYGFEPGTTPKNLRLFIHTVHSYKLDNLENVIYLQDPSYDGFLCVSYITSDNHPTYYDNLFGVSLDSENVNIANASSTNQASGAGKDICNFISILSNPNEYRTLVPEGIKKSLLLNDDEYADLYSKIQRLKYISQLDNMDLIEAGSKKLSAKSVKQAIMSADDLMINKKGKHNEANLYNPKVNAVIAKVDSIDCVPQDLLNFAYRHNLPIYLLGK